MKHKVVGRLWLVLLCALPGSIGSCGGNSAHVGDQDGGEGGEDPGGGDGDPIGGTEPGPGPGPGGEGGAGGEPSVMEPTAVFCESDKDCTTLGLLCDIAGRICVQCLLPTDCGDAEECVRGICTPFEECVNSLDCGADLVCVKPVGVETGRCFECGRDADCGTAEVCRTNACRTTCQSDRDCTGMGLICDFTNGNCTECLVSADCPDTAHCQGGSCIPNVCTPGSGVCRGNAVARCNTEGNGYLASFDCLADTCVESAGKASCEAPGGEGGAGNPGSGGSGTGGSGGPGGSGSAGAPNVPMDTGLIINGDFTDGELMWGVTDASGTVPHSATGGIFCANLALGRYITLGWPADTTMAAALVSGISYTFSFKAAASSAVNFEGKVGHAVTPFITHFTQLESVGPTLQTYSHTFTATSTDTIVGVAFNLSTSLGSSQVCIDDVTLRPTGSSI